MNIFSKVSIVLFVLLLSLIGCRKDEANDLSLNSSVGKLSSVAVFNSIPNSIGLTLYIGQGIFQKTAIADSDKLVFGSYVIYKNWYAGSFDIMIQNQLEKNREQVNYKLFLDAGKFYSLFLYRKNQQLLTLLSEDNIIIPKDDFIKIRMAHLSEGIANAAIIDGTSNSTLMQNIKFETVTDYKEINLKKINDLTVQIDGRKINLKDIDIFINRGVYTILLKNPLDAIGDNNITDYIGVIKQ